MAVGDHCGDDHVALVVERDSKRSARSCKARSNLERPAAPAHPTDRNGPPIAQPMEGGAQQLEVTDPVELGIIGHARRAIAEAELGAKIKLDLGAAALGGADEGAAGAPLIERERPRHLRPGSVDRFFRMRCLLRGELARIACEQDDKRSSNNETSGRRSSR